MRVGIYNFDLFVGKYRGLFRELQSAFDEERGDDFALPREYRRICYFRYMGLGQADRSCFEFFDPIIVFENHGLEIMDLPFRFKESFF